MSRVNTILLCFLTFPGCLGACESIGSTQIHLHHDYYVHDNVVEHLHGAMGYFALDCKMASPKDPMIGPDIVAVEWNTQIIIATRKTQQSKEYYIVLAAGEELQCGNNDSLLGPFSHSQLIQKRQELGLSTSLVNKKNLKLP